MTKWIIFSLLVKMKKNPYHMRWDFYCWNFVFNTYKTKSFGIIYIKHFRYAKGFSRTPAWRLHSMEPTYVCFFIYWLWYYSWQNYSIFISSFICLILNNASLSEIVSMHKVTVLRESLSTISLCDKVLLFNHVHEENISDPLSLSTCISFCDCPQVYYSHIFWYLQG